MTAGEKLEQSLTRRPDSYVPGRALLTLVGRHAPDRAEPLVANHLLHWATGATLGALRGVWSVVGLRGPRANLAHTVVRLSFDQTVENVSGAGAPPHTWPVNEQVVDVWHKAVFSLRDRCARRPVDPERPGVAPRYDESLTRRSGARHPSAGRPYSRQTLWRRVWDLNPRTFPSGAFKAPALGRYANPPAARGIAVAGCTPHHRIRVGGAVQPVPAPAVRGTAGGAPGEGDQEGDVGTTYGCTPPGPAAFWRIAQGGRDDLSEVCRFGGCAGLRPGPTLGAARPVVQDQRLRRGTPAAKAVPAPRCPMSQPTAAAAPRHGVHRRQLGIPPIASARTRRFEQLGS